MSYLIRVEEEKYWSHAIYPSTVLVSDSKEGEDERDRKQDAVEESNNIKDNLALGSGSNHQISLFCESHLRRSFER